MRPHSDTRPRVLVVADVGADSYHVGDEAVAQSAVAELAARGWDPVVITHGRHNREDYADVEMRRGVSWPNNRAVVLPAYRRIVDQARVRARAAKPGLAAAERASDSERVVDLIGSVDAVLVAGGGNLSSRFDWLLYERLAVLTVAGVLGRPAAVTGQTFGPSLVATDVEPIVAAMRACEIVGLREPRSVALGRAIQSGDVVSDCLDDAQFFGVVEGVKRETPLKDLPCPRRIVATFAPVSAHVDSEEFAHAMARELDDLAERTGAEIVLAPHKASWSGSDEDEGVARAISAASGCSRITIAPVTTARAAASLTATADLVVSSRYHPVVFALARGVPVLALAADDYGDARIDGVLARWGLGGWTVPLAGLDPGDLADAAMAVWSVRGSLTDHLRAASPALRAFERSWWDAIDSSLRRERVLTPNLPELASLDAPELLSRLRRRSRQFLLADADLEQLRCELLDERARRSIDATELPRAEGQQSGVNLALLRRWIPGGLRSAIRRARMRFWRREGEAERSR